MALVLSAPVQLTQVHEALALVPAPTVKPRADVACGVHQTSVRTLVLAIVAPTRVHPPGGVTAGAEMLSVQPNSQTRTSPTDTVGLTMVTVVLPALVAV